MNIVLGVGGGIAAYKVCHVLRELREQGHNVRVVPTGNALEFVGRSTWEALSGQPVTTTVFTGVDRVEHVRIGHEADLVIVAPATADLLARLRAGRADDLLTATVLATTAPVVVAPAMHTQMWLNPATRDNVTTLEQRGVHVLTPASGRLTGTDTGQGRLPEPHDIVEFALHAHASGRSGFDVPEAPAQTLRGTQVLISAGGTREALDPVRFLGNRSSGKQGIAFARAAHQRGATVSLVACNVDSALLANVPDGAAVTHVESTAELMDAMLAEQSAADVIIMAAAVSDYRPAAAADHKLKKSGGAGMTIELVQNPDVLRTLVDVRNADSEAPPASRTETAGLAGRQTIVGFAAETGSASIGAEEYARQKFERKGCDYLVFNNVSAGRAFGTDDNTVTVFGKDADPVTGEQTTRELATFTGSKAKIALEVTGLLAADAAQ